MTRYHFLLTAFCTAGISFIALQAFTRTAITTDEVDTFRTESALTPSERQAELIRRMGGKGALEIISKAKKVQAYRLDPNGRRTAQANDYLITEGPIDVPANMQAELSRVLSTHESMYWSSGLKGCLPVYGVRLKFRNARGEVDVNICFSCDELQFAYNGKKTGSVSTGSAESTLAAVAKALFPNDEEIQKIH
jgi:hypothetical protein